jgi:hypothetical protein
MWLKKNRPHNYKLALLFWSQAKYFYQATLALPKESAPLTAYYCFLNASKALLASKGVNMEGHIDHGVSSSRKSTSATLQTQEVTFLGSGVLIELCKYYGDPQGKVTLTMYDILYNLPYIHRAYTLTYSSRAKSKELFIPLVAPRFVRRSEIRNNNAWFCAELGRGFENNRTISKLPTSFVHDTGSSAKDWTIRFKKQFQWDGRSAAKNWPKLTQYHKSLRRHLYYIKGNQRLWYLKRGGLTDGVLDYSSPTLTFAAMHCLSELARYSPQLLHNHFENKHNWLLSEFIQLAPMQFIDEISSEITGEEFLPPQFK